MRGKRRVGRHVLREEGLKGKVVRDRRGEGKVGMINAVKVGREGRLLGR